MGNKSLKNIFIYSIVFIFLVNFAWGNRSFVAIKTQVSAAAKSTAQPAVPAIAPVVINVVTAPFAGQKVVIDKTAAVDGISCKLSASNINLNQAADCFSLSIDESQPALARFFVQPLHPSQQIVVIPAAQKISAPGLLPANPDAAGIPTLPAVFFVFAAAFLVFKRKLQSAIVSPDNKPFAFFKSFEVIPMRC